MSEQITEQKEAVRLDTYRFYVIFSFDIPGSERVGKYYPRPEILKQMKITEQGASEYINEETPAGKHRKLTALFTYEEFEQFIDDTYLTYEDVETMGSLTLEFGWIPAFSFNDYSEHNAFVSAYVTPMREAWFTDHGEAEALTEEEWERLRIAIKERYV